VAVCRDATSQWDEETDSYVKGKGPKDTFCPEHSSDRPLEEFAPIIPNEESDSTAADHVSTAKRQAVKATCRLEYRDSDSGSSSSSEDEYDEVGLSEWLPEARKRKRSPAARSSPAQLQAAAAEPALGILVEVSERWYRCVNQCVTKESCDPESDFKRNAKGQKLRLNVDETIFAKQVRQLDNGQTRVECMRVKDGRKTRKNLGWVSLVSKSGNTVLEVVKPENANQNDAASVAPMQQPKKKRKSVETQPEQVSAASEPAGMMAAAAPPRVPPRPRNLKPGVWQESTEQDGRSGWTELNQAVADAYEAAWHAGTDVVEYSGEEEYRYINFADFDENYRNIYRQVVWADKAEHIRYVRRKVSKNAVAAGASTVGGLVAGIAPSATVAAVAASATVQGAAAAAPKKRNKLSLARKNSPLSSDSRGDVDSGGSSGRRAGALDRYRGGAFLDDAPGGANGSHASSVFSNVALGPYGRNDSVYKAKPKKRKFANQVLLSSDEEDAEDSRDEKAEDESSGEFFVSDDAPIEVESDVIDLSTTNIGNRDDGSDDDAAEGSDDDFQTTDLAKSETAARLRAVAQEARTNDRRDRVAAADHADMAASATASAGRAIVAKCTDSNCICGQAPCAGGINVEHYMPNALRCGRCECCFLHRIFVDTDRGRKRRWNPEIKGGCCGRAPTPCPHVDPKNNQNSAKLGDDNAFMDRDIDESNFDDFEEPTSEPSEDERQNNEPANGLLRGGGGAAVRLSSRRQQQEARRRQNVLRLQQERCAAAAAASSEAPVVRPVVTKRTGQKGFMRSIEPAATGSQQLFPEGYRPVHSPQSFEVQGTVGTAPAAAALPNQQRRRGRRN
jgi:hypothetical protein